MAPYLVYNHILCYGHYRHCSNYFILFILVYHCPRCNGTREVYGCTLLPLAWLTLSLVFRPCYFSSKRGNPPSTYSASSSVPGASTCSPNNLTTSSGVSSVIIISSSRSTRGFTLSHDRPLESVILKYSRPDGVVPFRIETWIKFPLVV